jgi:hypothetical protein
VSATIRRFLDEQMEFEMGKAELIKLTDLSPEKVNQIIAIISRNNSERSSPPPLVLTAPLRVNGIIFLVMLILLVTENQSDILKRKTAVFSLMDFDETGDITVEEMEIILYCLAMGSSCILQRKELCPSAMHIRSLNMRICQGMDKHKDSFISFDEFLTWSHEVVSQSIDNSTTFDVYTYFVKACGLEDRENGDTEIKIDSTSEMPSSEDHPCNDNESGRLEIKEISLNNLKATCTSLLLSPTLSDSLNLS